MLNVTISDGDREAIDDPSIDERSKRKLLEVRMHELNVAHGIIAATSNITDDTVTNYLKLYHSHAIKK